MSRRGCAAAPILCAVLASLACGREADAPPEGLLTARQRAALVLCYYEHMSNLEAAAVLGVSVGALESLLVRARKSLRGSLAHLRPEGMA